MTKNTPSPSDTTRIIAPPRRGPRWIDLALAAVAGGLLTIVLVFILFLGVGRVAPGAASSPSPSATLSLAPTIPPSTQPPATSAPPSATPKKGPPTPTKAP